MWIRTLVFFLALAGAAHADGLSGGGGSGSSFGPLTGDVTTSGNAATVVGLQGTAITGVTGSGLAVLQTAPTLAGVVTSGGMNVSGASLAQTGIMRPAVNQLGLTANAVLQATITSTAGTFLQQLTVPNMTQTSVAQNGTVCWTTGTGALTVDTTVGCLASLEEMKDIHAPITGALETVRKLDPFWFTWKEGTNQATTDKAEQPGLGAHAVAAVDPRLAGYDADGTLHGVRYQELTAVLVAAIKEQQAQIEALKAELHPSETIWRHLLRLVGF